MQQVLRASCTLGNPRGNECICVRCRGAACSGFVFALSTGLKMLEHGQRIRSRHQATMLSSLGGRGANSAVLFGDGL